MHRDVTLVQESDQIAPDERFDELPPPAVEQLVELAQAAVGGFRLTFEELLGFPYAAIGLDPGLSERLPGLAHLSVGLALARRQFAEDAPDFLRGGVVAISVVSHRGASRVRV